jgi:predicted phage terminase large subunit-like protein
LELARKHVIDWFCGTLVSRLNDKERDPIIVVMQRLHEADLAGYLLEQGHWQHVELEAIAEEDKEIPIGPGRFFHRRRGDLLHPERESRETLDKTRSEMGDFRFLAQYQQRPQPAQGSLLKPEWFRSYDRLPPPGTGDPVVQSWDIAITLGDTNNYSVCTTWRVVGADYFLIDVFRARLSYPDLRREVATLAERYGAEFILIEDAGPGMSLLQDLRHELPPGMNRPIGIKPEGSKAQRMASQSFKIQDGRVYLPKQADWLEDYLRELLAFPNGKHDDQVDSVSQFLNWAAKRRYFETQSLDPGLVY